MEATSFWTGLSLVLCALAIASAGENVTELVNQLKSNQTEAIAADSILGEITPLFSGFASLNQKVCLYTTAVKVMEHNAEEMGRVCNST